MFLKLYTFIYNVFTGTGRKTSNKAIELFKEAFIIIQRLVVKSIPAVQTKNTEKVSIRCAEKGLVCGTLQLVLPISTAARNELLHEVQGFDKRINYESCKRLENKQTINYM